MTYCTGNRIGAKLDGGWIGTVSRCSSNVGPEYHGMLHAAIDDVVAFDSALTGTHCTARIFKLLREREEVFAASRRKTSSL